MDLERAFLKSEALEQLITADKFILADEIDDGHLLNLKHNGVFLVKVPADTNESNPYDGFWWSKTTLGAKRKVLHRHQSIWKPMEIFGQKTHSIQSTEMYQSFLRKQCVSFNGYVHIFYFLTNDNDLLKLPDEQDHEKPKKRILKKVADTMRKVVMPHRSVSDSTKVGKDMGFPVTRKQVANLARNSKDCLIGNTGPRAKTTLLMAENLKQRYPEQLWFDKDSNNVLTSLTFIHVYDEACKLFSLACPTDAELSDWTTLVDSLQLMSTVERKNKIEALLVDSPDGVFIPSRLHVDTTFNVGDVYLTVVLGEVRNFKTIDSEKARVLPLGYMLHSSKSKHNHEKFADSLKIALSRSDTALSSRKVPCVLADGEEALECYANSLNAPLIRCDMHILSLLRFNYGGKTAVNVAKPFLFGRKVDGVWKGGLFAVFTMQHLEKRLDQVKGHIDAKIHDWLLQNSHMLMESVSNYAKMRGGHLLQYSTNNANETFNSIIKSVIKKRYNATELILHLNTLIEEKIGECWLAASGCSEKVKLSEDIKKWSYAQKLNHFTTIGIPGARLHLMDIPPPIMKR
ncbi:hypothetical protein CAEBREN_13882 [Caenorhabditis brenneri]|uniref:MULE transposase domain-containing protein n=1 Tax=Caenorhabditis brenneri TaxID=135651 RepID=G0N315_CAEBE|nr:hypothetical protein CAEBREN_13882 [Caenorhabditis brenneri]